MGLVPFLQQKISLVMGSALGVLTPMPNSRYSYTVINISHTDSGMLYSEIQKHIINVNSPNVFNYRSYLKTKAYIGTAFITSESDELVFTLLTTKRSRNTGICLFVYPHSIS